MKRIFLIHWNATEAEELAQRIRSAGYEVDCELPRGMKLIQKLKLAPPAAIVIGLDRLPMQGRDVGVGIRCAQATRYIPLVFAGGEPEKVKRVQRILPDAVYVPWSGIRRALKQAQSSVPRAEPVAPASVLAGYSGTPLLKKLGIKENSAVALVNAPLGFVEDLGDLPPGVTVRDRVTRNAGLILWFVRSRQELESQVDWIAGFAANGPLWIIWPKRGSHMSSDLSQPMVRQAGLGAGLVDYKICSIDSTWSGLLFTRRATRAKA